MAQKILPQGIFEVFTDFKKRKLFSKSLLRPAQSHFGERLVREAGETYREWDPKRSKLAAAIMKGAHNTGIRPGNFVLYLGASHGYTPSHISDMIGKDGMMFAVEFSPQVLRDLVFMSYDRTNIAPILADANRPEQYAPRVSQVDVVFQDIAQRNQAEIFMKNCDLFLKEGGFGLLAVKARSINIKKSSKQIFEEVREVLEKKYIIADFRDLDPFEKDHCMIIIKNQKPSKSQTPKKKRAEPFSHKKEKPRFDRGRSSSRGREPKSFARSERPKKFEKSSRSKRDKEPAKTDRFKKFVRKPGESMKTKSGKKFLKKQQRR